MNPFSTADVAHRYQAGRPYFHPLVMQYIRQHLHVTAPLARALDVGCGTGLSSLALTELAEQVLGIDPSQAMLDQAPHSAIRYQQAPANAVPVDDGSIDLVTAASAFHLFNRPLFFVEMRRVLRPGGWVVVYENAFSGTMQDQPAFAQWFQEYWAQYPRPAAFSTPPLTSKEAATYGWTFAQETYENTWRFTQAELVAYLLSLSNVSAALEQARTTIPDLTEYLVFSIAPFFRQDRPHFQFGGAITYLQPASQS